MWFVYALVFAVTSSFSVLVAKKIMRNVDQYTCLLFSSIFTFPFLLTLSLLFYKVPKIDGPFWFSVVVGTAISVSASILAYKAIRESEISLVNPISAFNPVFTAIISFFTLGERIDLRDMGGILLVVTGAYFLQLSKSKRNVLAPFKALLTHNGVRLSFVAYFLWAITPTFEKTAIFHTFPQNPPFAALAGQVMAIAIFAPLVLRLSKKPLEGVRASWKMFLVIGLLGGVGVTSAFIAYSLSPLGVVTAVFKLSMIIVPILGWLFFKEKDIKERILGSLIMLLGVILLVT